MTTNISSLLFYPFNKDQLSVPKEDKSTLFWNAPYVTDMRHFQNADHLQTFKPEANQLDNQDFEVKTAIPDNKKYDYIFSILPKQKDAARFMIATSFEHLEKNGLLITIAANDAGGKNIEKWMKDMGATPSSLSKNKCRIVWATNNNTDQEKIISFIQVGQPQKIAIGNHSFTSQAGVFGWNKIDRGSQLLIQNLPHDLTGIGADFGCGYGYLSYELLKNHKNIKEIHALEADYNALNCTKENLKPYPNVKYHWSDLTQISQNIPPLDWIIMNPPFHEGKQTKPSIGLSFIETAAHRLKENGTLYMVANINLPYEKTLQHLFTKINKIHEHDGYKIFVAQK